MKNFNADIDVDNSKRLGFIELHKTVSFGWKVASDLFQATSKLAFTSSNETVERIEQWLKSIQS